MLGNTFTQPKKIDKGLSFFKKKKKRGMAAVGLLES